MNSFEAIIHICCHNVSLRYWDFEAELTDELKEDLTNSGEERARECLKDDICSGELIYVYVDDNENEEEIRGYWDIESD